MLKYITILAISFFCLCAFSTLCAGGQGDFFNQSHQISGLNEDNSSISSNNNDLSSSFLLKIIKIIYDTISGVDGNRCPMYPNCSSYSLQAIEKHGIIIGIIMTSDRLIHESNEMDYAPLINVAGDVRYFDPVSNNDFWWHN
jgi:hypothetical protein